MNKEVVLVVEDDNFLRERLLLSFQKNGHEVYSASNLAEAYQILSTRSIDWCLSDLKLGEESGTSVIEFINNKMLSTKIVILTGYGSIISAVNCMKLGITNYLSKPVSFPDILKAFKGDLLNNTQIKAASLEQVEWEHIQKVLNDNEGNISKTAKALKLHRRSLQRKLNKKTD